MGNLGFLIALGKETAEGDVVEVGGFEVAGVFGRGLKTEFLGGFLGVWASDVGVGISQSESG